MNEQIVLTSVAAESISESTEYSTFNDYEIIGTGRTVYLQFTFTAQLGFDGMGVVAEEAGPGEYVVTVPEFAVIDHDDLEVQALAENNGVLGWITPEGDTTELIEEFKDNASLDVYVDDYRETLERQATAFYEGIIHSIDPDAVVTLQFGAV